MAHDTGSRVVAFDTGSQEVVVTTGSKQEVVAAGSQQEVVAARSQQEHSDLAPGNVSVPSGGSFNESSQSQEVGHVGDVDKVSFI